jgi:hypothetical protein
MATSLDSAAQRIAQARAKALKRPAKVSDDTLRSDGIEVPEALDDLMVEMLAEGARLAFGTTDGSADVWARLSYPLSCNSAHAGMVAFVTAGSLEKALRKVAQCVPSVPAVEKYWKVDRFARE